LINNLLHISFVSQCLHASGIINVVKPNIPDTIANIKQKSLHGRYFKELEQPEVNIQASHAWLKKSNIHPETEGFIFAIQDRVINTRSYKKHICGLQSIIDKCRICGTEGKQLNTSFLLAPFWLKANIKNVTIYSLKLYT
jgi:hypothetical protein